MFLVVIPCWRKCPCNQSAYQLRIIFHRQMKEYVFYGKCYRSTSAGHLCLKKSIVMSKPKRGVLVIFSIGCNSCISRQPWCLSAGLSDVSNSHRNTLSVGVKNIFMAMIKYDFRGVQFNLRMNSPMISGDSFQPSFHKALCLKVKWTWLDRTLRKQTGGLHNRTPKHDQ